MFRFYYLFLVVIISMWIMPNEILATMEQNIPVKIELLQEEDSIEPGRPFWVAVHLTLEEGWHVYWKNPGDAGIPLTIEWDLPAGFEARPTVWPFPEKFTVADMVGYGYSEEVTLLTQIIPSSTVAVNQTLPLKAHINWLVCSGMTCQPGSINKQIDMSIRATPPSFDLKQQQIFEHARQKIPESLLNVKTSLNSGLVQFQFNHECSLNDDATVKSVSFFPEDQEMIDVSIDPTLTSTEPNRYLVSLKGSDEIGAKSKILKGVLVIHKQKEKESKIEAFNINSPIESTGEVGLLSYTDHSLSSRQSTPIVGSSAVIAPSQNQNTYEFEGGVGLALLFAFLGGMILNLMPCVLPVLSIKVMSFVKMARESRSLTIKHGLMFSVGVIISFWVLASAMLILRAYGQAVGWGFQLQEPLFVIILAGFLFLFALNLFGIFELGMSVASWAGETQSQQTRQSASYTSSFLSGVLATAVATPCTGPFLGSAVGFAFTLPYWQSLLIFTSLALGMCFPYLLLAAFPAYLRFIPKPGAWMETFKQLMGFVLLATVLWLLWVFSSQTNAFALMGVLVGFFLFSFAAWIYGQGINPMTKWKKQLFVYASVCSLFILGCQTINFTRSSWTSEETGSSKTGRAGWEAFSPERVAQLRKEGKPILIDFTAKWCLICQANHMILATDKIEERFEQEGVVKMVADWTKNDPIITAELNKFGRNSVPLYVMYGNRAEQNPIILPQVLSEDVVLSSLNDVLGSDSIALK